MQDQSRYFSENSDRRLVSYDDSDSNVFAREDDDNNVDFY